MHAHYKQKANELLQVKRTQQTPHKSMKQHVGLRTCHASVLIHLVGVNCPTAKTEILNEKCVKHF